MSASKVDLYVPGIFVLRNDSDAIVNQDSDSPVMMDVLIGALILHMLYGGITASIAQALLR